MSRIEAIKFSDQCWSPNNGLSGHIVCYVALNAIVPYCQHSVIPVQLYSPQLLQWLNSEKIADPLTLNKLRGELY